MDIHKALTRVSSLVQDAQNSHRGMDDSPSNKSVLEMYELLLIIFDDAVRIRKKVFADSFYW